MHYALCILWIGENNDIGFNEGIHTWSVKYVAANNDKYDRRAICYHSIGVTNKKYEHLLTKCTSHGRKGVWITGEKAGNSFYDGSGKWEHNTVITVKLDCNDWSVTYYKDGKKMQFEGGFIEEGFYYFVLVCCGASYRGHMEVVENPSV